MNKQLIKEAVKEMIRDGEIRIKVSETGDRYSYSKEVSSVACVESIVADQMNFELEIIDYE